MDSLQDNPISALGEQVVSPDSGSFVQPNEQSEIEQSDVKRWLGRITRAKQKWEMDFKRMRKNMEFVTGLQWAGQTEVDDERYTNNLTLRMVNQKVASLYAKNPTAIAERRKRLDFQLWDGNVESLQEAAMQAQGIVQSGALLPPQLSALFEDYTQGKALQKLTDKICKTLEVVYQYSVDTQRPEFKEQVKQAVRRAIICGVAYCRPIFYRESTEFAQPISIDVQSGKIERAKRAKRIMEQIAEGEVERDGAQVETLKSLALSLGVGVENQEAELSERLEFDFPMSDSVIPDERCRSLKEFVAARWMAQEYILAVEEVNALFGTEIKVGGSGGGSGNATEYTQTGELPRSSTNQTDDGRVDPMSKSLVLLYEVWDYVTKTRFFVCAGWKEYVLKPEVPTNVSGFWHHFALTFNDIESGPGTKASIFPPSDVQLVKSPQKEWNRTREALRDQRNANAPKYLIRKGLMTKADQDALRNALPNSVVELEGIPPEQHPDQFVSIMRMAPIDPSMYDTRPLSEDMQLGAGIQEANMGPAQPNVTATVGTIAEQSRMTVSASNIDDLDGWLTRIAQCGGELCLREMSKETVLHICGPGAVWPSMPQSRADALNQITLKIKAASSGRPNKAIDVANFRDLAPIMQAAGANPVGLIEEAAKRMDDNINIDQFFPVQVPVGSGFPQGVDAGTPPQQSTPTGVPQGGMLPTMSGASASAPGAAESSLVGR